MCRNFWLILNLLLLSILSGGTVNAMTLTTDAIPQPLNAQTIAAFVNDFMSAQMDALHVPGAALVVVQGDTVLFAQGYGQADLAGQVPVDVDQTLFRAGSISKLFTATAVMQLVEQGKVDLHTDVNEYLHSIQLPARFDQPVTVADLLLHTAGFDDIFFGMHVREAANVQSLADFLDTHLPERYLPPGEIISYNDHGYTLAGLLVEDVTGMRFDAYVAQHILEPLQMDNSTFAQPLPPALQEQLAVGYRYDGESYQPYALDYVNVVPAAGLIAPAAEMAHFIIAQLNGGSYAGNAILQPETVVAMQEIQFVHHPALRGRSYGFAEWRENGRRGFYHDGGNPGFLNRLLILPAEGMGFYLTFNGDQYTSATRFHREFTTHFFDTFFPDTEDDTSTPVAVVPGQPAQAFAGYYREVQAYSHDTFQKLASLMNQFPVRAEDEQLAVFGRTYVPVESQLFQSENGESTIAFGQDAHGHTYLFVGAGANVRVPWYEAQPVQLGLVGWFLLAFLTALIGAWCWRTAPTGLRMVLALIALLNILFLVGISVALLQMDPWQFAYGPPPTVIALLVVPLVTLALTPVMIGFIIAGWRDRGWKWTTRLYTILVSATALAFPLFLNVWNLLGFRY